MSNWQAEKRLWQAVILQAIEDLCKDGDYYRLERQDAHSFFTRRGDWRMSLNDISDAAGWSSSHIRKKIKERRALLGNNMIPKNISRSSKGRKY